MQPRYFWAPLYGITNSKLYFTTLLDSLKDVTDKFYIFRAYKSPDGSVKNATGFLPGPLLQSHAHMKAIQEVLQMACGFSVDKVKHTHYTAPVTSSQKYQRHGVSLASAGAKLVDGVTVWLNYPLLDQRPTCCGKHRARVSALPDLYAKNDATKRPLAILGKQMKALRDFSVKCGSGKLPMHGGLQNLTKFKTMGGPHED